MTTKYENAPDEQLSREDFAMSYEAILHEIKRLETLWGQCQNMEAKRKLQLAIEHLKESHSMLRTWGHDFLG